MSKHLAGLFLWFFRFAVAHNAFYVYGSGLLQWRKIFCRGYSFLMVVKQLQWVRMNKGVHCSWPMLIFDRLFFCEIKNCSVRRHYIYRVIWVVFLLAGVTSCANYKIHYSKEVANWEAQEPGSGQEIQHTIYLIGDAGKAVEGRSESAVGLLKQKLVEAGTNSSVIFLGDNIYPDGMAPHKNEEERKADEAHLDAQLNALKGFTGNVFFISGNHDWYGYGVDGLKRQRKYIEDQLGRKDVWEPDCGCGDPKEIEISEDLVIILLDSQWWLENWKGDAQINQGCEVKSRGNFRLYIEDALKSNREKNVVVALHHPLATNGPHGGNFTLRQHLFPLTEVQKNLWLPLPIIGSIYPLIRSSYGTNQDLIHPNYSALKDMVLELARKNGQFIFASGHEHSLQYIETKGQSIIVSGAGSKRGPTKLGNGAQFTYGNYGLSQLDFYEDGSVWLSIWSVEEEQSSGGKLVFRKKIKGPLAHSEIVSEEEFPLYSSGQDSITVHISKEVKKRKGLGANLWGKHYREAYHTEVKFPILRLDQFEGGVSPVKKGGGYQTSSLRLKGTNGKQYTMRSVEKDPTRMLHTELSRSKLVLSYIKDGFNAAHPMAATPIPQLARAANVWHTNPTVYYVPPQPRLGNYNTEFGGALYLVEERPNGKHWQDAEWFGFPDDIVSTPEVLEKTAKHHSHVVDPEAVVRARIFDILIGDWDRHDDQWRWAKFEEADRVVYRPIPRDRDQAFSKYDGWIYGFARSTAAAIQPLRAYSANVKTTHLYNFGARHFDATFLAGTSWEMWESEIQKIQNSLTDSIVQQAFLNVWPQSIYNLDAPEIIQLFKERRAQMPKIARAYYEYLSKKVDVVGTTNKDLFEVSRQEDGTVIVQVYDTNSKGDKEQLLFQRTFLPDESKEISLYALADDDIFHITGATNQGPLIRMIGGEGKDVLKDESKGPKNKYYDDEDEEVSILADQSTKTILTDEPKFNSYDRKAKQYDPNFQSILPSGGFNPDDKILLGFQFSSIIQGFKKTPFAAHHKFSGNVSLATGGVALKYHGVFAQTFNNWDFELGGEFRSPLYSFNFYGLGNETRSFEETQDDANFHRVKQTYLLLSPLLARRFNDAAVFKIGVAYESHEIQNTAGRFIEQISESLRPEVFGRIDFAGVKTILAIENLNAPAFPTHGLKLHSEIGWKTSLNDRTRNFAYLEGNLSIYQQLSSDGRFVIASRVGGKHIFNNKFEFYQGANLGGLGPNGNIRGFRRERFTGKSSLYHNTDLRWEAISSNNELLPFTFGFLAGFDHGRVWLENDLSDTWHYSYGGGVWVSPLQLLDIRVSMFRGDGKNNRLLIGSSFFF